MTNRPGLANRHIDLPKLPHNLFGSNPLLGHAPDQA
jgi:hypothetical protein